MNQTPATAQKPTGTGKRKGPYQLRPAYRLMFTLHNYLGLILGAVIVLVALTGSVAVYWRELNALSVPAMTVEPIGAPRASIDDLVGEAEFLFPQLTGSWRFLMPGKADQAVVAEYYSPPGQHAQHSSAMYLVIDPYDAGVRTMWHWNETTVSWIYTLHMNLQLGDPGHAVVGWIGVILIVLYLGGLYLWWPRQGGWRRAFLMRFTVQWPQFEFDSHRLIGLYSLPLIVLISITGINIVFPKAVSDLLRPVATLGPERPALQSVPASSGARRMPPGQALAIAQKRFPGAQLSMFVTPDGPQGTYRMTFNRPDRGLTASQLDSQIYLDQYSGAILFERDPDRFSAADTFLDLTYPLHNGMAFGELGRLLVFLTGPTLCWLYFTGLSRWLRKHRRRKAAR